MKGTEIFKKTIADYLQVPANSDDLFAKHKIIAVHISPDPRSVIVVTPYAQEFSFNTSSKEEAEKLFNTIVKELSNDTY